MVNLDGTGPRSVTVLVRSEQLRLTPTGADTGGQLTARVLWHDFHGHDTVTVVRLADGTELLSPRLNNGSSAAPGTAVEGHVYRAVRAWEQDRPSAAR